VVVLPSQRHQSPTCQKALTQPISVPIAPIIQVSVPVESVPSSKPDLQLALPSRTSADKAAIEKNLLSRIDGVVSEMERELSEDLVPCGSSPLHCLRNTNGGIGENENTIDWIDKQIWAIEHRREACEMRQAHLADLRRMVAEGQSWGPLDKGAVSEGSVGGSSTVMGCSDEEHPSMARPTRLAVLEAEQELLRKQVECERQELLRVREALEGECESRLADARGLAEAAEGGKRRAWAAEEAADQRARDLATEAAALQDRLRQAEAAHEHERQASLEAKEAQAQASQDLQLLEENSRAVLDDCRSLQGKVRDLQSERAALLSVQAGFEEERRMLQTRIRLLEEQRTEAEVQRQALADENYSLSREHNGMILSRDQQALQEESALMRREALFREELAQRDATLASAKASWCQAEEARSRQSSARISELENELAHSLSHGESQAARVAIQDLKQQVADALAAEAGAERRARTWTAEAEQRHLALVAETESLRSDLAESKAAVLRERSARQEAERRHQQAEVDADRARAEHQQLAAHRDTEKQLHEEGEARHRTAEEDLRRDFQQLQTDHAGEKQAREEVEQRHRQVVTDFDHIRAEHERLLQCRAAESRAAQELEQKHKEVEDDNVRMLADLQQLRQDLASEQEARQEVETRHRAVEEEMRNLHGDKKKLATLMEQEQQARQELEHRHKHVQDDRQQVHADREELLKARDDERSCRLEAEQRHRASMQEFEQLKIELHKLQVDRSREQQAREELERSREAVQADLERVLAEQQSLQEQLLLGQRAREDAERRHQKASEDTERFQAAHREAERRHHELEASHRQLRAEKQELEALHEGDRKAHEERAAKIVWEAEQRVRDELEIRHQEEKERLRNSHQEARGVDRQAYEELKRMYEVLLTEKQRLQGEIERLKDRCDGEVLAREDAERNLRLVHDEKADLSVSFAQLQKAESHRDAVERSLRQARLELEDERRRSAELEQQLHQMRRLEDELEDARNATMRLKAELEHAKIAEESLKRDAEEAMEKSTEAKRKLEMVWREKLDQAKREIEALKGTERSSLTQVPPRMTVAHIPDRSALLERRGSSDSRSSVKERLHLPEPPSLLDPADLAQQKGLLERPSLAEQQRRPSLSERQKPPDRQSLLRHQHLAPDRSSEPQSSARSALSERPSLSEQPTSSEQPGLHQPGSEARPIDDIRRKHSLWIEPMVGRASIAGLLDDHAEGLRHRVKDVRRDVTELLQSANQLHFDTLQSELEAARVDREAGRDIMDSLQGLKRLPDLDVKRGKLEREVISVLENVRSVKSEAQAQLAMKPDEQRQLIEIMDVEISRCEEELELLERDSALRDIPETLIETLVDLSFGHDASTMAWDGDFSPMHWCALHGRRDLLEFIRRQPWGSDMVNMRDRHGCTPCFYAERQRSRGHKRSGLISYLREEVGVIASPCQPTVNRPRDLSMLDKYKLEILSTVEKEGWHAVKWKDGKSMLHWAAEKGHGELCEYLVRIGADIDVRDGRTRTPVDCADQAGHPEIARLIQTFRDNPSHWVFLSAFPSRKTQS